MGADAGHNIDRRFIAWSAAGAEALKLAGWQRLKAEYAEQFGVEA